MSWYKKAPRFVCAHCGESLLFRFLPLHGENGEKCTKIRPFPGTEKINKHKEMHDEFIELLCIYYNKHHLLMEDPAITEMAKYKKSIREMIHKLREMWKNTEGISQELTAHRNNERAHKRKALKIRKQK